MRYILFLFIPFLSFSAVITYNPLSKKTSSVDFVPSLSCYTQKKINVTALGYTLQCYDVANNPTSSHYVITHIIVGGVSASASDVPSKLYGATPSQIASKIGSVYYYTPSRSQPFYLSFSNKSGTFYYANTYGNTYDTALNTKGTMLYSGLTAYSTYLTNQNLVLTNVALAQTNSLLSNQLGVSSSISSNLNKQNTYLKSIAQSSAYNAFSSSSSSYQLNNSLNKFMRQNHKDLSLLSSDLNSTNADVNSTVNLSDLQNILLKHDGLKVPSSSPSKIITGAFDNIKKDIGLVTTNFNHLKSLFSAKQSYTLSSASLFSPSVVVYGKKVSLNFSAFIKFEPIFYFIFTLLFLWIAIKIFFFGLKFGRSD